MAQRSYCFLLLLSASLGGCDGSISVEGVVLAPAAETNSPASRAFIDATVPDTAGWIPVPDATVWVFHNPEDTLPGRDSLWVDEATTDNKGRFRTFSTACPCKFTALLRVRAPGFDGVSQAFRHESLSMHSAVVLLRRTPVSQESEPLARGLTGVAAGGGAMERAEALAAPVHRTILLDPPQLNAIR